MLLRYLKGPIAIGAFSFALLQAAAPVGAQTAKRIETLWTTTEEVTLLVTADKVIE